jgi:hypothetical protein
VRASARILDTIGTALVALHFRVVHEEAAVQYDLRTPADDMKGLDDDWRRSTVEALRGLIGEKAPELREGEAPPGRAATARGDAGETPALPAGTPPRPRARPTSPG